MLSGPAAFEEALSEGQAAPSGRPLPIGAAAPPQRRAIPIPGDPQPLVPVD
jgi:hypothetical protein